MKKYSKMLSLVLRRVPGELGLTLEAMGKEGLTLDEYTKRAKALGCRRIVTQHMVTTCEYDPSGDRANVRIDENGIVLDAHCS